MAVTFQVNLVAVDLLSNKQPWTHNIDSNGNDTQGSNFSSTRSTWFPDLFRDNRKLKHGATFVVNGADALNLLNNYTYKNTFPTWFTSSLNSYNVNAPDDFKFLNYVSGTIDP